jgi:hypothetical protein
MMIGTSLPAAPPATWSAIARAEGGEAQPFEQSRTADEGGQR